MPEDNTADLAPQKPSHAENPAAERADDFLYSRAAVDDGSVSDESRSVDVVASTEDIDGHGTRVKQNWNLARFKANPVVLYSHNSWELPIGTAENVRVEKGQLRATLTFSTADLNPQAEQVWKNVKAKVIRGVSVGFRPRTVKYEKEKDREVCTLDDNELYEISMTPVPSNPATLAQMRARAMAEARGAEQPTAKLGDLTAGGIPATNISATPAPAPVAAERAGATPGITPEGKPMPEEIKAVTPITTPEAAPTSVLKLLGASTEAEALTRASELQKLSMGLLGLTGAGSIAEAMTRINAWKVGDEQRVELDAKVKRLEGETSKAQLEASIQRLSREGRLPPSAHDWARSQFESAAKLDTFALSMPEHAPIGPREPTEASGGNITLTEEQRKICVNLGLDEKSYLEQLKLDRANGRLAPAGA